MEKDLQFQIKQCVTDTNNYQFRDLNPGSLVSQVTILPIMLWPMPKYPLNLTYCIKRVMFTECAVECGYPISKQSQFTALLSAIKFTLLKEPFLMEEFYPECFAANQPFKFNFLSCRYATATATAPQTR